ncbi:MAG TPA: winged helix-turn-helix domain-containing protein [Steroidobacteraceae bacterium]
MNAEPAPVARPDASAYQVDDLLVDVRGRRVTRDGEDLEVADRSFDLLLALVRAAPNLMSVQGLMDSVWAGVIVGPDTITQRIKLLRQRLGDSAEHPRYIAAVRGHGYRMAAAVTPLAVLPQPIVAAPARPSKRGHEIRRWLPALFVLATLVVAGFVWWGLDRRTGARVAANRESRPPSAAVPRFSVAVLPFVNLTADPGKDYFGDGMADELINSLSQVAGLKVPARTSSFAYKGSNTDIRQIAHDLEVAMVLEGSVRSAGGRIRVTAELVDARSGYHVWSQSYDRNFSDIFNLQDELAAQIVAALQRHLGAPIAVPSIRTPPTQDVEAYRLYLQAAGTAHGNVPSLLLALPIVNAAVARDPNFAAALALRAGVLGTLVGMGGAPLAALDDAERDARRALVLNSGLAGPYLALGMIYFSRRDWVNAELSYQAALVADATDSLNHGMYSLDVLEPTGRLKLAHAHAVEAFRLAPASGFTSDILSGADSLLGLDAEAIRFANLDILIGSRPHGGADFLLNAHAAARRGRYAEAAKLAVQALPEPLRNGGGAEAMRLLYSALADPSKRPAALRALQRLTGRIEFGTTDAQLSSFFVEAFTLIGAVDAAYGLANELIDRGERLHVAALGLDPRILWVPEMRPFRQDRRLQELASRLKLVDYWQRFGPPDGCDLENAIVTCH